MNLVPVFTVRFCAYLWVEILEHHAVNIHSTPNRHCIKTAAKKLFFKGIPLNRDFVNRKRTQERSPFFPQSHGGASEKIKLCKFMVKEGVKNSMFRFICETNRKHGWNTQTRVLCRLSDWAILHLVGVYVVLQFLERKKYMSAGEIWHPRETLTSWSFFCQRA